MTRMRSGEIFSLAQIGASVLLILAPLGCDNDKYPSGRDTVKSFGDGRFQIGRTPSMLFLIDMATKDNIMLDVKKWESQGELVYLVNKEGMYTVLNYRTGYHKNYPRLDDVPPEHRSYCKRLTRG